MTQRFFLRFMFVCIGGYSSSFLCVLRTAECWHVEARMPRTSQLTENMSSRPSDESFVTRETFLSHFLKLNLKKIWRYCYLDASTFFMASVQCVHTWFQFPVDAKIMRIPVFYHEINNGIWGHAYCLEDNIDQGKQSWLNRHSPAWRAVLNKGLLI